MVEKEIAINEGLNLRRCESGVNIGAMGLRHREVVLCLGHVYCR